MLDLSLSLLGFKIVATFYRCVPVLIIYCFKFYFLFAGLFYFCACKRALCNIFDNCYTNKWYYYTQAYREYTNPKLADWHLIWPATVDICLSSSSVTAEGEKPAEWFVHWSWTKDVTRDLQTLELLELLYFTNHAVRIHSSAPKSFFTFVHSSFYLECRAQLLYSKAALQQRTEVGKAN